MLPTHGLPLAQYTEIIVNTEHQWQKFAKKIPGAIDALPAIVQAPLIQHELISVDVPDDCFELVIKRSLLLLYCALGPAILSRFFNVQQLDTIIAAFPFAAVEEPDPDWQIEEKDLQMTLLYAVLQQLCFETNAKAPMDCLYEILNDIALPYNKHLFIVRTMSQSMNNYQQPHYH